MSVFFDIRSTSGRVRDDEFDAGAIEDVDRLARQLQRAIFFTGMNHEGAAARLLGGSDDFISLRSEHASGRRVYAREKLALHATEKQPNTRTLCSLRRGEIRHAFARLQCWHQCFHRSQFLWEHI